MPKSSPAYPEWFYFPAWCGAPGWVAPIIEAVASARPHIDSGSVPGLTSDKVLSVLRSSLEVAGYVVETGRSHAEKIRRPVLFGPQGRPRVEFQVDGWHPDHKVIIEIEAGRSARGNALYRDLVRASLIVDAEFLVLGVMKNYKYGATRDVNVESYRDSVDTLAAIYESRRLGLPFAGVLLFGY